jgi:streptomycin 6-kinase
MTDVERVSRAGGIRVQVGRAIRRRRHDTWVRSASRTAEELAASWSLDIGPPLTHDGDTSVIHEVVLRDGTPAILKVSSPGEAVTGEAEALRIIDGGCAVRLLRSDAARGALLLERVDRSTTLEGLPDRELAIDLGLELLTRWWRPASGSDALPTAADLYRHDANELTSRRRWLSRHVPAAVVDRAIETMSRPTTEEVLLHGDLHLGNALMSDRGWVAIDPQPLVGPRAHDLEPLLRDADTTSPRRARARLERVADRAGVDREEAAEMVLARGLCVGSWAIENLDAAWGWRHIDSVLRTVS